jgi:hypothetical protein
MQVDNSQKYVVRYIMPIMKYNLLKIIVSAVVIIAIAIGVYFATGHKAHSPETPPATNPSTQTPVQTKYKDLIQVNNLPANQKVSSPLVITGQARGTWFFEASFPVKLVDANNKTLATGVAQAQGEWMTENYVPFSVTLNFTKPTTATGFLILERDNPSGLPQNADEFRIPVEF